MFEHGVGMEVWGHGSINAVPLAETLNNISSITWLQPFQ